MCVMITKYKYILSILLYNRINDDIVEVTIGCLVPIIRLLCVHVTVVTAVSMML